MIWKRPFLLFGLVLGCWLLSPELPAAAQNSLTLRITQVDTAEFPTVRLNVLAADGLRNPTTIDAISLRENGVPVGEFELRPVPVGIDVVFVLDANAGYLLDDGGGVTRAALVADSITTFANRFMSPAGQDRVSIVVPGTNGEAATFLLEDAAEAAVVIEAIAAYAPDPSGPAPLQEMMALAVSHLTRASDNGRFQAVMLMSDAGTINTQLRYSTLVEAAQAIDLPLYAVIVGAQASFAEVDNVELLTEPTRARWVHLARGDRTDAVYLSWQGLGVQQQLTYTSLLRESTTVRLSINVGGTTAQATFELVVLPPQPAIELAADVVERTGPAFDTPVSELTPAQVMVPVAITWPDERPRELALASLTVDGQVQPAPSALALDDDGRLLLPWSIVNLDDDVYELEASVTDVFGYEAVSPPFLVALTVTRPPPPTATPLVTSTPPGPAPLPTEGIPTLAETALAWLRQNWQLWLPFAGGLLLVWLLLSWWRGRRPGTATPATEPPAASKPAPETEPDEPLPRFAYLERLGASLAAPLIALEDDNVTLGRDTAVAQIALAETSLARLHARIRRRQDGYWLYDEGSTSGTLLNFERLGLAPRRLQAGDTIQLGRLQFRFVLSPAPLTPAIDEEE